MTPPENAEERNFEKRQYFTGRTVTPPENAEEKNFEKRQYFTGRTVTPPENGKFLPFVLPSTGFMTSSSSNTYLYIAEEANFN